MIIIGIVLATYQEKMFCNNLALGMLGIPTGIMVCIAGILYIRSYKDPSGSFDAIVNKTCSIISLSMSLVVIFVVVMVKEW